MTMCGAASVSLYGFWYKARGAPGIGGIRCARPPYGITNYVDFLFFLVYGKFMDSRLDIIDSSPDGACSADGAAIGGGPVDDAREARRRARLAGLDEMAEMVQGAARSLSRYIGGELDEEAARPFANIADPCAALTRLARAQRQIFALQERADDAAEARARRLADAAAGRRKAEQSARAEREAADKAASIAEKKRLIRRALKEANHARGPGQGLPRPERERLLDDLFSDYERYDDFDRDVADIMEDLAREAELAQAWTEAAAEAAPDPADAGLRMLMTEIERRLLHMLGETDADEAGSGSEETGFDEPEFVGLRRAQGPP